MLDSDRIDVILPGPPYPLCGKEGCGGSLLPNVEPATGKADRATMVGGVETIPVWIKGTAITYWKCSLCKRRA